MVRNLGFCGVLLAVLLAWPAQARAAPCDAAEREMAYGAAAMEEAKTAKDKAAYLRAARQFEGASRTAPNCAAARFNMGFAYEHAGELQAAKDAYGAYLRLAPNASDARAVRQRIYKLEYRIGRAKAGPDLAGKWLAKGGDYCGKSYVWKLEVNGNRFRLDTVGKKASGVPGYEGRIEGARLSGEAYIDWSAFINGRLFRQAFTGTVSGDGRTLAMTFRYMEFQGMVGARITGWRSFDQTCTFGRAK